VFTDPLSSNGPPIVEHVCFRENVFTGSLPSNGYTRHSITSITPIEMSQMSGMARHVSFTDLKKVCLEWISASNADTSRFVAWKMLKDAVVSHSLF
jgi:hypothetical protein